MYIYSTNESISSKMQQALLCVILKEYVGWLNLVLVISFPARVVYNRPPMWFAVDTKINNSKFGKIIFKNYISEQF